MIEYNNMIEVVFDTFRSYYSIRSKLNWHLLKHHFHTEYPEFSIYR